MFRPIALCAFFLLVLASPTVNVNAFTPLQLSSSSSSSVSSAAKFVASPLSKTTSTSIAVLSNPLHNNGESEPNSNDEDSTMLLPLAMKMAGVLAIKTAKDVINYPPKLLDHALLVQQEMSGEPLPKTSPIVMLIKLLGVLVFKSIHDAIYYPTVWTQRMVECQSLEECNVE